MRVSFFASCFFELGILQNFNSEVQSFVTTVTFNEGYLDFDIARMFQYYLFIFLSCLILCYFIDEKDLENFSFLELIHCCQEGNRIIFLMIFSMIVMLLDRVSSNYYYPLQFLYNNKYIFLKYYFNFITIYN